MNDQIIIPKRWYQSKTIWGGIFVAGSGLYESLAQAYHWNAPFVAILFAFGISLTTVGLRTATQPIGNPNSPLPVVPAIGVTQASDVPAQPDK